jgi:hypothetical protein
MCPPGSPLREASTYENRTEWYGADKTSFIGTDHVAAMDVCSHPENQAIHGYTAWFVLHPLLFLSQGLSANFLFPLAGLVLVRVSSSPCSPSRPPPSTPTSFSRLSSSTNAKSVPTSLGRTRSTTRLFGVVALPARILLPLTLASTLSVFVSLVVRFLLLSPSSSFAFSLTSHSHSPSFQRSHHRPCRPQRPPRFPWRRRGDQRFRSRLRRRVPRHQVPRPPSAVR